MSCKLVAVGPSLIDLNISLPDECIVRLCEKYKIAMGDWREISDLVKFNNLLDSIGLQSVESAFGRPNSGISKVAGSSTLSMLAAQPPSLREESTYISSLAVNKGVLTKLSYFFNEAIRKLGITHRYESIDGENSLGLVLAGKIQPEKILFFHPGVSRSLTNLNLIPLDCDLLIIDAYELQEGPLAHALDKIILSGQFRIALSLGNRSILHGKFLTKIQNYIFSHKIFALAGNADEYHSLAPHEFRGKLSKENTVIQYIAEYAKFALLTLGDRGMIANWGDKILRIDASYVHPSKILSTSGGGDVAAGVFFAGVAQGQNGTATLTRAAQMASKVIQLQSSMICG